MNSFPDRDPAEKDRDRTRASTSAGWRVAAMDLIASRVAMIQLESQDAAARLARRLILLTVALGCAVATWLLTLAGGIAWLAQLTGIHWSRVALITALAHLCVAAILIRKGTRPLSAAFSVTRKEFQKDRTWIEHFLTNKNSNV